MQFSLCNISTITNTTTATRQRIIQTTLHLFCIIICTIQQCHYANSFTTMMTKTTGRCSCLVFRKNQIIIIGGGGGGGDNVNTRDYNYGSSSTAVGTARKDTKLFFTQSQQKYDDDDEEEEDRIIQIAYQNFHNDLLSMRSLRTSKFQQKKNNIQNSSSYDVYHHHHKKKSQQKLPTTTKTRKQQYYKLFKDHPTFIELYYTYYNNQSNNNNNSHADYCHFTNLTQIVGPMYRYHVENMILSHPKMVLNILSSLVGINTTSIDSVDRSNRSYNEKMTIRSVQDQIIQDLNLSSSSSSLSLSSSSPKDPIHQLQTIFLQKKAITNKMSRKNVRSIFQTFTNIIDMNHEQIQKVFFKAPKLFTYSNDNIEQSILYLKNGDHTGFSNEEIVKMIQIRPMVLTHCGSYSGVHNDQGKTKIDLIITYFRDDLNVDYKSILIRNPQLFDLNVRTLEEKVSSEMVNRKVLIIKAKKRFIQ